MNRILYYALGGGLGHLTRTVALARQLQRVLAVQFTANPNWINCEHVVATNTPFSDTSKKIANFEPAIRFERISAGLDATDTKAAIINLHDQLQPDIMIVDTFPRGLGGELVELFDSKKHRLRILISRQLPRAYVKAKRLGDFVAEHYDLVIAPGESFGITANDIDANRRTKVQFLACRPFLIRDANELPNRLTAAKLIGVDSTRPTVLLVGSGNEKECRQTLNDFEELSRRLEAVQLRVAMPKTFDDLTLVPNQQRVEHWPLIECLPAVDFVIGSAGYNLFWETESQGIARHLTPQNRKYDDQFSRVTGQRDKEFDLDGLVKRIDNVKVRIAQSPSSPRFDFTNGAVEAATAIVDQMML